MVVHREPASVALGRPWTNNAEYVDNDRVTAEKHGENRETINRKPEHPQRESFDLKFIRDNSHITYSIAMSLNQAPTCTYVKQPEQARSVFF